MALFAAALMFATGAPAESQKNSLANDDTASAERSLAVAPSPARFFTINAVLAKAEEQHREQHDEHDGRANKIRLASLSSSPIVTDAPGELTSVPQNGPEPFGLFSFRAPEGTLWRKWRGVEAEIAREKELLDRCNRGAPGCPAEAAQYLRLIEAAKMSSGRDRLDLINRGVNDAVHYVSDLAQHGENDVWSSPLATFASAAGDCEDFVIAKYVALREAGIAAEDIRIVLVRDRGLGMDHAVVATRHEGRWLIMDNRFSVLMEDSEPSSLTPLFAIDDHGVHLLAERN